MKGLTDRAAIVTGAGQGIGRAIAVRLLDEGARVLAVDIRAEWLSSFPANGRLATMTADVTATDAPVQIIGRCVSTFGGVSILVNNVGLGNAPPAHAGLSRE